MKLSCVIPTMLLAATTSIVSADFPATVLPVENTWLNAQR